MKAYQYKKADAFTSGNSLGNPAACLYLEKNQQLTDLQMLEIAQQHHGFVSEVVYCTDCGDGVFNLVYFSSQCEVNFCGHGTIACMYSLISSTPALLNKKEFILNTRKKGSLTLYNNIPQKGSVLIAAPEPIYLNNVLPIKEIARGLEMGAEDISTAYPIDFIDAGNKTLIVPIKNFDTCIHLFPDEEKLKAFSLAGDIDVILVFSMSRQSADHYTHTRVFSPKFGYLEDPATGSANAAFGYYMLKHSLWQGENIILEQGGSDRIFNAVNLCVENKKLLLGGSATTRIEGVYYF